MRVPQTLDAWNHTYTPDWRFDTANFSVIFYADDEDMAPEDSFDDAADIERAHSGNLHDWFCAVVAVYGPGGKLAAWDTLGGCSYGSIREFYSAHRWQYSRRQRKWITSRTWKACDAKRPRRSDGSRADGHYFPGYGAHRSSRGKASYRFRARRRLNVIYLTHATICHKTLRLTLDAGSDTPLLASKPARVFSMIYGKPGDLVKLRKADIRIPEYQREIRKSHVNRIAREFDWFLFGVLIVSQRQGETGREHYIVDGQHRLEAARMLPQIEFVPCMLYDFMGPQHEAEVFVKLQRWRRATVTEDEQRAELVAAGEFGRVAYLAQQFLDALDGTGRQPLGTIKALWRRFPAEMERLQPVVAAVVRSDTLHKDFLEAAVYLERDLSRSGESLATTYRARLLEFGYRDLLAAITAHLRDTTGTTRAGAVRVGKVASKELKAEALRSVLGIPHQIDAAA